MPDLNLFSKMMLGKNNSASKLFKSDLDERVRELLSAKSYFNKVYPDNIHAERAPFLSEVQQYMMDRGIIPSRTYQDVTPEMMEAT